MNVIKTDINCIISDTAIDWHLFKNSTVLIAGANAMLAQYMILTLLYLNITRSYNCKIVCLIRKRDNFFLKAKESIDSLLLIEQDIAHSIHYREKIDYIIHAASKASNSFFYEYPDDVIIANAIGTYNLLQLALKNKVKGFLFFSSGEVYGDLGAFHGAIDEHTFGFCDPLNIRNCYAESKRMAENMCACWAYKYGVKAKIVRISHTYGPTLNLNDERIFSYIVSQIIKNEDIVFHTDGTPKRPFCYITDATRAFFLILLKGSAGEAYNLSPGYMLSIKEIAEIAIKESGCTSLKIHCTAQNTNNVVKETYCYPSNKKLVNLGWQHHITENEGFRRTIEYFKSGGSIYEQFLK